MTGSNLLHADETRRLTVILAADIAGYSALMGADELQTVHDLKGHQAVVLPMIARSGGRVIDTAGDGIFAEFPSVQKAVRCAVALQAVMAERNVDVERGRRMQFRIGINQADVVSDETRIYGDGVNIAARLESICEPGGIVISAKVYDEVAQLWGIEWTDIGEQSLKNIRHLVRAYRFSSGKLPPDAQEFDAAQDAPQDHHGVQAVVVELPDVSGIAVLPFTNMSGDKEQDYFADGITEDLITELSRFNDLIVIARNSTDQFKDRAVDVREVGRKLGVRYLLEGSTRKSGDRVRITAQLVSAEDGSHLWAEKYDRKIEDIFDIQDDLVRTIIPILACQVTHAERARSRAKPAERWQAHDFYMRAVDAIKAFADDVKVALLSAARIDDCRHNIQRCLELDPDYSRAYALLSATYTTKWAMDLDAEFLNPETLQKALVAVETAIRMDPNDPNARAQYAHVLSFLQRRDRAYSEYQTAMRLNPHFTDWRFTSVCIAAGRPAEAVKAGDMLRRADPLAPAISTYFLGVAHYLMRRFDAARMQFAEISDSAPNFAVPRRMHAAALAQLGRLDEAREQARFAMSIDPTWRISGNFVPTVPQLLPDQMAMIVEGMKKAGLPD